jgi:hypothetical protein
VQYSVVDKPSTEVFTNKFYLSKSICDSENRKDTLVTMKVRKTVDDGQKAFKWNLGFKESVSVESPE